MKTRHWIALFMALAATTAIAAIIYMSQKFENEVAVRVNIPREATAESVRDSIYKSLGEDYGSTVYRLWNLASGDPTRSHGSYLVEPGASALKTANAIYKGHQTPVRVVLNNMRTLDDLARRLSLKTEASAADFKAAVKKVLTDNSGYTRPEEFVAAFIPDTYEFYWTDEPEEIIKKLVSERDSFWTEERLLKAARLGLTPVEVATVASIVEEESNKADEHPIIARLYINRLKRGIKLQADPTVKYALGNFALRRIGGKMLSVDSAYNTYKVKGLPPGPIRIPRRATIDAVLDAPEHDYIFMCAKSDFSGRHDFAVDAKTHLANARRYQAQLNKRGIRR